MKTSAFFKLFPPPKFLEMPYAGLDINDSSVHCLMYRHTRHGLEIDRFGKKDLPKGVVEAGIIRDEKSLAAVIRTLADELKVTYVKVSLPEERMYLFKTEVPDGTAAEIHENIALRLDENVPLSPEDAIFYFDLIRDSLPQGRHTASVSVAPQKFVESYISVLQSAGIVPVSFEVVAKSVARAVVPGMDTGTKLVVNLMDGKVGFYIVDEGVVLFTSTVPWTVSGSLSELEIDQLRREMSKVYGYWDEHGEGSKVDEVVVCGSGAPAVTDMLARYREGSSIKVSSADVWSNAFSCNRYIPAIPRSESFEYAVVAGLALPSHI